MRTASPFFAASLLLAALFSAACDRHSASASAALEQAGFSSDTTDELKKLKISDTEIPQVAKLKQFGLSDDACLSLVRESHARSHIFTSADSVGNLVKAGYSEPDILTIARKDQLDSISNEAITLTLIGLSPATVQYLVARHLAGQPTLSSPEIARLKNTGLSEKQILDRINQGMTDAQAEKEAALREAVRNHANTGFVRTRGRR
jgi:hypothetical protein